MQMQWQSMETWPETDIGIILCADAERRVCYADWDHLDDEGYIIWDWDGDYPGETYQAVKWMPLPKADEEPAAKP